MDTRRQENETMAVAYERVWNHKTIGATESKKLIQNVTSNIKLNNDSFSYAVEQDGLVKFAYKDQQLTVPFFRIRALIYGAHSVLKNGIQKLSVRIILFLELERIRISERGGRHVDEDRDNAKNTLSSATDDTITMEYDGNTLKFPRVAVGDFLNCCFDAYHAVGNNLHLMIDMVDFLLRCCE
jgi:hypothetical protein